VRYALLEPASPTRVSSFVDALFVVPRPRRPKETLPATLRWEERAVLRT
jgi:hypothetical protein